MKLSPINWPYGSEDMSKMYGGSFNAVTMIDLSFTSLSINVNLKDVHR